MPKDPNELGALWEKTSANGTYMTGKIGDQAVVVFRNTKKSSDKSPDWRVLKPRPRTDEPTPAAQHRADDGF